MKSRKRKKKAETHKPAPNKKGHIAWIIGLFCLGLFATIQPLVSSARLSEITGGSYKFGGKSGIQDLLIGITALSASAYLIYEYKKRE